LKNENINVEIRNRYGNTLLMVAGERGNYEIVKILLDYGADVNATKGGGFAALLFSINHVEIVELLLNYRASDRDSCTPLIWACSSEMKSENTDVINLLLKRGANINARGGGENVHR